MKIEKINIFLVALFISWGPIFWLPYIGKIIVFKLALLTAITCLNMGVLYKINLVVIANFVLVLLLLICVTYDYADSFSTRFVNVYLNIICAFLFYMMGKYRPKIEAVLKISCNLICIYCLLLLFFQFFHIIEYFPIEYSRELSNGTIVQIPLYATGWGFGRTQWSTSLSVFVPAHFVVFNVEKDKARLYLGVFLIIAIQFMSGGRGGLVASLLIFLFLLYFFSKKKIHYLFFSMIIVCLATYSILFFKEHFRLTQETLSHAREDQWRLLISILQDLPLKGYGHYGGAEAMVQFEIDAFHNSFFRCLFGYGIAGLYVSILIMFIVIKSLFSIKKDNHDFCLLASHGIVICGFICTFTEPNPIIISFYWPLWWFIAGYLSNSKESIVLNEIAGNNTKSTDLSNIKSYAT